MRKFSFTISKIYNYHGETSYGTKKIPYLDDKMQNYIHSEVIMKWEKIKIEARIQERLVFQVA